MNQDLKIFRAFIHAVTRYAGLSPTKLAAKAGVAQSTVNRPMRVDDLPYAIKPQTMVKIGEGAGLTEEQTHKYVSLLRDNLAAPIAAVIADTDRPNGAPQPESQPMVADEQQVQTEAEILPFAEIPMIDNVPPTLPVKRTLEGPVEDGEFTMLILEESISELAPRPKALEKAEDAYALRVIGSAMSPVFFDGDIAIVDTTRRPAEGDFVLIDLGPKDRGQLEPGRTGPYVVRRLLRRTAIELVCELLNPDRRQMTFPLDQVAGFWRVMHPKER